jgi:hypothetical protein
MIGDIVHLSTASAHFIRDVHGEIAGPAFGGLERDRQSRPEADIFTDTLMGSTERFLRDLVFPRLHQKERRLPRRHDFEVFSVLHPFP